MKRVFDIIFSLTVLLLFLPLGFVISVLILISSKGGIFYKQTRIGKNKKPFSLLKFRSMKIESDKKGKLTVGMNDKRITKKS